MDERDELLREIDKIVRWAAEFRLPTTNEVENVVVSTNRSPEAVRRIAKAMERARTLRGVKW